MTFLKSADEKRVIHNFALQLKRYFFSAPKPENTGNKTKEKKEEEEVKIKSGKKDPAHSANIL